MNLTDVDDRTIAAARGKGVSLRAHVDPFARAFEEDRDWLRIKPAHEQPRATEYIGPMIELIQGLLDQGRRLPRRGRLGLLRHRAVSRRTAGSRSSTGASSDAGASERVSADEYGKEDARDFVLWKAASPEDEAVGAAWDAPFGRGRPGWHIECSAMALELIRRRLRHRRAGHPRRRRGPDLPAPRGRDRPELRLHRPRGVRAGVAPRRVPQHPRHKMSKRFGNITTARDLREDGVDPGAVRLLMFQVHYRKQLDLTDEALASAREGSRRLGEFQNRLLAAAGSADGAPLLEAAERLDRELAEALDDDLNAPRAVAAMFAFASAGNAALDAGEAAGPRASPRGAGPKACWRHFGGAVGQGGNGGRRPGRRGRELEESPPAGADEEAHRAWAIRWAVGARRPRRRGISPRRTGSGDCSRPRGGRCGTTGMGRSRSCGPGRSLAI